MDQFSSKDIAVGIVLYYPDETRFRKCLDSILPQTQRVYIFENAMTGERFWPDDRIFFWGDKDNRGLAYALNRIMEQAKGDGFHWVVTMDQDSILPPGLINAYAKKILQPPPQPLGILCPQVIDRRRAYLQVKTAPKEEFVSKCITSASCTFIPAWEQVGGFDEWLFIDLVDNEFCKRLQVCGYQILRLNPWVLDQEFGTSEPKSEGVQRFWLRVAKLTGNPNFAKFSYKKYVSPMRVYYTNRNIIYVNRKLKPYGAVGYESYHCHNYPGFLISFSLPSIFRAQHKWNVAKAVLRGIWDGLKHPTAAWRAEEYRAHETNSDR